MTNPSFKTPEPRYPNPIQAWPWKKTDSLACGRDPHDRAAGALNGRAGTAIEIGNEDYRRRAGFHHR